MSDFPSAVPLRGRCLSGDVRLDLPVIDQGSGIREIARGECTPMMLIINARSHSP